MFNSKRFTQGIQCLVAFCAAMLLSTSLLAAGGSTAGIEKANTNMNSTESLQRGAKYFVNYCLGCHSAKYVRYSRVGQDLDISEDELVNNLMFNSSKPFETMTSSMKIDDANRWFGAPPPDLSLIARSRNVDWLYSYLKGFYSDSSRPLGSNNIVLPGASMPNIFWELQGEQVPQYEEHADEAGKMVKSFSHFAKASEGTLSNDEFDGMVRDIVNFLDYIGEPVKAKRKQMGVWVLFYLVILFLFAYALKQEIWKDVH